MTRRNPYEAIQQAFAAEWDVVSDRTVSGHKIYTVTHPSDPGEAADERPYIFDSVYLDTRSAWRAVLRYIAKHQP